MSRHRIFEPGPASTSLSATSALPLAKLAAPPCPRRSRCSPALHHVRQADRPLEGRADRADLLPDGRPNPVGLPVRASQPGDADRSTSALFRAAQTVPRRYDLARARHFHPLIPPGATCFLSDDSRYRPGARGSVAGIAAARDFRPARACRGPGCGTKIPPLGRARRRAMTRRTLMAGAMLAAMAGPAPPVRRKKPGSPRPVRATDRRGDRQARAGPSIIRANVWVWVPRGSCLTLPLPVQPTERPVAVPCSRWIAGPSVAGVASRARL